MPDAHVPFHFETPHGAVRRCACCGRLEVHFAGAVLRGPVARFSVLAGAVEAACAARGADAQAWTITLRHVGTDRKAARLSAGQAQVLSRLLRCALKALDLHERCQRQATRGSVNTSGDAPSA